MTDQQALHEVHLRKILAAWKMLPPGYHTPRVIAKWMNDDLGPAIKEAMDATVGASTREVLGVTNGRE